MAVIEVFVDHFLAMDQDTSSNPRGVSASNTLVMTQSARISPFSVSVEQTLNIGQVVDVRTSIKNINVAHTLSFSQNAGKGPVYHHIDHFLMWHEAKKVEFEQIVQTLLLSQEALGVNTKGIQSSLTFTQSATYNMVRSRSATHSLVFSHYATAYKVDGVNVILTGEVTLATPTQITLTYGTTSINLRNPNIGDSRGIEQNRINRRNRGGDLLIYRDPLWPKNRTLRFQFSYLSEAEKNRFQQFLLLSLGQEITLVDYEGVTWVGIIRTPESNIIHAGRFNYEAEFEFEGEKV